MSSILNTELKLLKMRCVGLQRRTTFIVVFRGSEIGRLTLRNSRRKSFPDPKPKKSFPSPLTTPIEIYKPPYNPTKEPPDLPLFSTEPIAFNAVTVESTAISFKPNPNVPEIQNLALELQYELNYLPNASGLIAYILRPLALLASTAVGITLILITAIRSLVRLLLTPPLTLLGIRPNQTNDEEEEEDSSEEDDDDDQDKQPEKAAFLPPK